MFKFGGLAGWVCTTGVNRVCPYLNSLLTTPPPPDPYAVFIMTSTAPSLEELLNKTSAEWGIEEGRGDYEDLPSDPGGYIIKDLQRLTKKKATGDGIFERSIGKGVKQGGGKIHMRKDNLLPMSATNKTAAPGEGASIPSGGPVVSAALEKARRKIISMKVGKADEHQPFDPCTMKEKRDFIGKVS